MLEKKDSRGPFTADFIFREDILSNFEAFYKYKQKTSPVVRVALGVFGTLGAVYFGSLLYKEGISLTRVGYLFISSMMLLVSLSGSRRSSKDETVKKYRKYYTDKKTHFLINEDGVEMRLEGQRNFSKSKFSQIYGLFETDLCFYFVIKGKGYYIIEKSAVQGGSADELHSYMESHCKKRFQKYDF